MIAKRFSLGLAAMALAASGFAADEWQTLTVTGGEGVPDKKCEIKVPKAWTLQERGATSEDVGATLVYETEKPETWWTKRKRFDFRNSRMFTDNKTNYWIQVKGAMSSDKPEGTTFIAGVRDGGLVCHLYLEFKSDDWDKQYEAAVREMVISMKPIQ